MKRTLILTVLAAAILLTGCSKTPTTTTNSSQATQSPVVASQSDSGINPELKSVKFVRVQLTDPALYDFNQTFTKGSAITTSQNISSDEQKKIGETARFSNSTKYGITGIARIISTDTVRLESFSYNGGCGNLVIGLSVSNSPQSLVANLKTISTPLSSTTIDLPNTVSLLKFDSINAYCPDNQSPVSSAMFSN
jgi:hypothetical protein